MFRDQDSFATFVIPAKTLDSLDQISKSIISIGDGELPEIVGCPDCSSSCSGHCAGSCSGSCYGSN